MKICRSAAEFTTTRFWRDTAIYNLPAGQTATVDNRSGAHGSIASEYVARARPDGHTLLFTTSALAINMSLYKNLPFDALRDFALTSQENDIVEASLYALSKHTGDRAITVLTDIATSGKTTAQRKLAIASIAPKVTERFIASHVGPQAGIARAHQTAGLVFCVRQQPFYLASQGFID